MFDAVSFATYRFRGACAQLGVQLVPRQDCRAVGNRRPPVGPARIREHDMPVTAERERLGVSDERP